MGLEEQDTGDENVADGSQQLSLRGNHGQPHATKRGLCVCHCPQSGNLGKMPFSDGAKSEGEKLRARRKEALTSFSVPPALHLPPCGRRSVCSAAWPEGSVQGSGREVFGLERDRERLGPSSWGPLSGRLESSGRVKEDGKKPLPHED